MNKKLIKKRKGYIPCACCGSIEVPKGEAGYFYICNVCGWENDLVQNDDPDYDGGANKMNLNEAKEAYKKGLPVE